MINITKQLEADAKKGINGVCKEVKRKIKVHSAGLGGHGCVFQRPPCGAKRPHVITGFLLPLS